MAWSPNIRCFTDVILTLILTRWSALCCCLATLAFVKSQRLHHPLTASGARTAACGPAPRPCTRSPCQHAGIHRCELMADMPVYLSRPCGPDATVHAAYPQDVEIAGSLEHSAGRDQGLRRHFAGAHRWAPSAARRFSLTSLRVLASCRRNSSTLPWLGHQTHVGSQPIFLRVCPTEPIA